MKFKDLVKKLSSTIESSVTGLIKSGIDGLTLERQLKDANSNKRKYEQEIKNINNDTHLKNIDKPEFIRKNLQNQIKTSNDITVYANLNNPQGCNSCKTNSNCHLFEDTIQLNDQNGTFNCEGEEPYYVGDIPICDGNFQLDIRQESDEAAKVIDINKQNPPHKTCPELLEEHTLNEEDNIAYSFLNNNKCYIIDGERTASIQSKIKNLNPKDCPVPQNTLHFKTNNFKQKQNVLTNDKVISLERFTPDEINDELRHIPGVNNKLKTINQDYNENNTDLRTEIEKTTNELLIEQDKFSLKSTIAKLLNKIIIFIFIILLFFISFHTIDIKKYTNGLNMPNIFKNIKLNNNNNKTNSNNRNSNNSINNIINRYK